MNKKIFFFLLIAIPLLLFFTFLALRAQPPKKISQESWSVPINLILCKKGEHRLALHGLGSVSITVVGYGGLNCIVEFEDELEGGQSLYECKLPITRRQLYPAKLNSLSPYYGGDAGSEEVDFCTLKEQGHFIENF